MSRGTRLAVVLSLAIHALLLVFPLPAVRTSGRSLMIVHLIPEVAIVPTVQMPPSPPSSVTEAPSAPRRAIPEEPDPVDHSSRTAAREPAPTSAADGPAPAGQRETAASRQEQGAPVAAVFLELAAPEGEGRPPLGGADMSLGGPIEEAKSSEATRAGEASERDGDRVRGGGSSVPDAPDAPLRTIRERILAARRYPPLARRKGWEGRAKIRFRVGPGGYPDALEVVESSGVGLLDRASTRAVEEGAPYPPVEGWIVVPIVYRLEG